MEDNPYFAQINWQREVHSWREEASPQNEVDYLNSIPLNHNLFLLVISVLGEMF